MRAVAGLITSRERAASTLSPLIVMSGLIATPPSSASGIR